MNGQTALLFPGQGSQYVGMGIKARNQYSVAAQTFQEADDVLGFPLSARCFAGPQELLTDTLNAQPAILALSIAYLRVAESAPVSGAPETGVSAPAFLAGHSLGEYTALVAAGALSFADALRLVRERGRLMKEAGEKNPGRMTAVIGVEVAPLEAICREASGDGLDVVQIANYNAPGQLVISGAEKAVERASALAKERGAKRVIPLPVSIASHSPLMQHAAEGLRATVNALTIQAPRRPVVANVTARPLATASEIKQELLAQLTSSVRWIESMQFMAAQGVNSYVEIGPKDVLVGLQKRITPEANVVNWEAANDLGL